MRATAREVLRRDFGYPNFRGHQEAIIDHTISGGDSLVLMPTGGGKSLCYQIPGLVRAGTAVVVSPLIALMQDQVEALCQSGIRAACLNSSQSAVEYQAAIDSLRAGHLDLLYAAPERLLSEWTLNLLASVEVALFAIDEAHCVSQWGHDFRPDYQQLCMLAQRFPEVPRIALTATADEPTRREIIEHLGLVDARVFVSGFDRPNIHYKVVPKRNAKEQLLEFLAREHRSDAGIIYCLSRKKVEQVANWLRGRGFDALPYHAGMSSEERSVHQSAFLNEEGVVIVATIAFGMGIDKSNVRFVAHLDLPKSIESYYQETGRAGRDGLPADAWMAYGLQDVIALRQMSQNSDASIERKRLEARKLDAMLGYCELTTCRRQTLLGYFGDQLDTPCGNCDNCLEPVQTWDATEFSRKALSCVYRTGQQFGVGYVTEVLMGKLTDRIQGFGHDRISTFGIGKELNIGQWRSIFRQLVARGLLNVDTQGFGSLTLSPASRSVLRGEVAVYMRRELPKPGTRRTIQKLPAPANADSDSALWEALREQRLKLAHAQGVPPYVIFHDATLQEMLQTRPRTLVEFNAITGVGEKKLKRYGQIFLDVLRDHNEVGQPINKPMTD